MTEQFANVEQAAAWDGAEGDHWVEYADRYDALSQRLTQRLLEAAAIQASDRVLDIGCGCGLTTRAAARAASEGSALGVDLSALMLREAERRAHAEGLDNVRFEQGDAQVHRFPPGQFDLAISHFGVMFFDDPVAAFANVGSALRPGGRFVLLCWQDLVRNDWIMVPAGAAIAFVPFPDLGPEGGPGPFSLADPDRLLQLLTEAGFEDVDVREVAERMFMGENGRDTTEFLQGTSMARLLFENVDAETERKAIDAVRDLLKAHEQPDGVWLGSAAWLVTATRPDEAEPNARTEHH